MYSSQRALQTNGKLFSNFEFVIFDRKPNLFQKKSEALILIKLQCVIYQWIRLNELYKLMLYINGFVDASEVGGGVCADENAFYFIY